MENKIEGTIGTKPARRYLKIGVIVFGAVLILVVGYFVYFYIQIQRGEYVKWNGIWYTKEELKEKYPPQYVETPAKNTPEEVYTTFRQALLDGNLELALEQITEQRREEYREILNIEGSMEKWGNKLPEKIIKEKENGNYAYYDIDMGTKNKNTISFFKDITGYWKLSGI